jgi:hypothetical protein
MTGNQKEEEFQQPEVDGSQRAGHANHTHGNGAEFA